MLPREKEKLAYYEKLKKRYQYNKEVRRILRHRHVPKFIKNRQKKKVIQTESKKRKEENIRMNAPSGTLDYTSEKRTKIAGIEE